MKSRNAPTVAWLIHLLIEERAKVLRWQRGPSVPPCPTMVSDADRDQARREIEREHLSDRKEVHRGQIKSHQKAMKNTIPRSPQRGRATVSPKKILVTQK